MTRKEFLAMSPREFDALTERLNRKRDESRHNVATLVAAIYNTVCDYQKRPDGFSPEDFLPGTANKASNQSLKQFAIECEKNDYKPLAPTEEDRANADEFLKGFTKTFNYAEIGKVQLVKE